MLRLAVIDPTQTRRPHVPPAIHTRRPASPCLGRGLRTLRGCADQSLARAHAGRRDQRPVQSPRVAQGHTRRVRRGRPDGSQPPGDAGGERQGARLGVAQPLRFPGDQPRRRSHPPRRARLRRRHPHPLGRPGHARRPGLRPGQPECRAPGAAVRVQQRLRRLRAPQRQQRARPAVRQPRVHQRGADVSRYRAPGSWRDAVRKHDPGDGRHRDGRARRFGAGGAAS